MGNHPLTVMHVIRSLDTGGMEIMLLELLRKLDTKKFRPLVCCLEGQGSNAQEAEGMGVKVVAEKKKDGFDPGLIFRLARLLKRERVVICHSHNYLAQVYSTVASRLSRTPVTVHTQHGMAWLYRRKRWIKRRFLSYIADKTITVSTGARDAYIRSLRLPSHKVAVVPNGVDLTLFRSRPEAVMKREEIGLKNGDMVVGTVARLSPEKDHFNLLRAFSLVTSSRGNVKLLLVGDGPMRDKLKEMVRASGLMDKVVFLGNRRDVPELLNVIDIFVLPSLTEGLSMALLEAMATGKPIVATNVGGNPEIVMDGETGIIAPPRDPENMAGALLKILSNRELAREMGRKGRERVEKEFSLEKMTRGYEAIYEELLAKKGLIVGRPL